MNTNSRWPAGLLTALVTPLRNDAPDFDALESLVERQITAGARGVIFGGGTGEFGALSFEERVQVASRLVELVAGRCMVVVQTGALATRETVSLSHHAQESGADALMVASPFGEPINWRERKTFYETVTSATSLPVMIYNTPAAGPLTLENIVELSELPHVSAVKDSSGDPDLMGDLLSWTENRDFAVYAGKDSLVFDYLAAGARGVVMGSASFIPDVFVALMDDVENLPPDQARGRWLTLRRFLRFMENSPNYVSLCKAGCRLEGLDAGDVRPPFMMPSPEEHDAFADQLRTLRESFGPTQPDDPVVAGTRSSHREPAT